MNPILTALIPLFVLFVGAYGLRRAGVLRDAWARTILMVIFYVGIPALILNSVPRANIDTSYIAMVAIIPAMAATTLGVLWLLRKTTLAKTPRKSFGAMAVGALIANGGMVLPFVNVLYGAEGMARFVVADTINAAVTFSLVYAVAVYYGSKKVRWSYIVRRIAISPPILALVVALAMNSAGLSFPAPASTIIGGIASLVAPVLMIVLGIKFQWPKRTGHLVLIGAALRMCLGLMVAAIIAMAFGLTGPSLAIVLMLGIAPAGYNSMTFAEIERLDSSLASAQVSLTILMYLIALPVLLLVIR